MPAFAADTGSAKMGGGTVFAEITDALCGKVRIQHDECGGIEHAELCLEKGGGQMLVDRHVVHGKRHVAVGIGEEKVGRGRAVWHIQALAQVDAERGAGILDALCAIVCAEGGDELDVRAKEGEVVGNVASHAAEAGADASGVGIAGNERRVAPPADIDVHAADNGDIRCSFHKDILPCHFLHLSIARRRDLCNSESCHA